MTKQHTEPCKDCPWRRTAAPGWLGSISADEWVQIAHGECHVECHTIAGSQCAGIAIYRANVVKKPRDPQIQVLPKDKQNVFATPTEFLEYHAMLKPSDIFLRAAIIAAENKRYSCLILARMNIPIKLSDSYESMFAHDVENCDDRSLAWWDVDPTDRKAHELRVVSLLFAHAMHLTGDL